MAVSLTASAAPKGRPSHRGVARQALLHYLGAMAIFPRPARPGALIADLKAFLKNQGRPKYGIMALSVFITSMIVLGFYHDAKMDQPKARVIYAESWPASRTDEEIIRQNIADQKELDAWRLETQRSYQRLADKLGIEYEGKK